MKFLPFVIAITGLLLQGMLMAQGPGANVTGEVRDPSGAILVGAKVTARNTSTNVPRSTLTDAAGIYVISALQPGLYTVTAETTGFSSGLRNGLVLEVAQTARIDFTLQVGNTAETVNVSASAAVLETETASTGQVVDNRKVVELPLNGRQFYGLALLGPDTYQPAENSTVGYRGGFNVAGADETENNFSLNGIDNNDTGINGPTFLPSIDSIQEFKILTGIFPAEYGHSAGSQVIVVTKAGTNELHGSAFEFVRNQFFDANNYFTAAGHQSPYKRNQFGATAGGPIRKEKTFFFYSYEGLRLRQGITSCHSARPGHADGKFQLSPRSGKAHPTEESARRRNPPGRHHPRLHDQHIRKRDRGLLSGANRAHSSRPTALVELQLQRDSCRNHERAQHTDRPLLLGKRLLLCQLQPV
jgi:hypothetical protein